MPGWGSSRWSGFGVAIIGVLVAAAARAALEPVLGDRAAYLPFVLAILATVLACGPVPAVLAAIMSLGFGWYFSGFGRLNAADIVEAATFLVVAAGIIALGHLMNRARRRASVSDAKADARSREARQVIEELNLLIDGAHGHAIYMLDTTGHVTIWNEGAERLKGWSEAEVLGKHASLFYPPDARAIGKPEADLARAREEGRFEEEDWRLRKDGREFLAAVSTTALVDEAGELRGFAKIVSDITDKRAAENTIRAREDHLSSILSTVPDAMVVINDHGVILSFSAAAQALFGYSEEETVGRNVSMLMPSPDRERHDSYIARYLETGEKRIIGKGRVVFAARKDGSSFPMELSIGEASTGDQRIFTGFVRDLTERRHTEARLEDLRSELIHVSRVSAMGSMASTLAHELNQPIGAIANYVEAVRDRLVDLDPAELPMLIEALGDAAKDALRAGDIVRRLREFVARGEVARTVERLPALINEASVLGLIGARERGIEARFDLDPYASPVFVDRVQIQQVLINLIRNACEAMKDQDERRVTVTSRLDRAGFARVTVMDTGPGVAPEIANQLFTAFVSTKQDGMGLGLSICRTIIEANEGRIWMEPGEGGGTCFHFTLPLAEMEDEHGEQ
ncbi:PAS domain S-box protein [Sphingomonas sp. H39-1-10]|uniref:PAS domain S-box protein n=2 Tax=Sphingomonas TaxID=13687 RepID=UPI000B88A856|nr:MULTISPECIES: PAS domain S-box protein [Sphingomonas]MDF0488357.1 PAS domain S-box protein [Sphingomonas pollutisoli]